MFDEVTTLVVAWLKTVSPDAVVVPGPPGGAEGPLSVFCHLADVTPSEPVAGYFRHGTSLKVRYLITVRAPSPQIRDRLLGDIAVSGTADERFRVEFPPLDAALWLAFGVAPQPCLFVHAPVHLPASERAPHVSSPPQVRVVSMADFSGRVLGPGDNGLAGARITVLGRTTRTNIDGEFHLSGLSKVAGRQKLLIEAGEFRQTADVDLSQSPSIIQFSPQKV